MTKDQHGYPKLPVEVLELLGLSQDDSVYVAKGSVNKITTPRGPVWLKIVEQDRKPLARKLLRGIMNLIPIPAMAKTEGGKNGDTLLRQAEQADNLRKAGFNTPETVYVSRDFYISTDSGRTLYDLLLELNDGSTDDERNAFAEILLSATRELARLHKAGFAHGRPKMRDFGWKKSESIDASDGEIFIFDLEERPWEIMPMADAQARDIVLWLVDLCQYRNSQPHADEACAILFDSMSDETARTLLKIKRTVAPLAPGTRWLQMTPLKNREMRGGLGAYELLKRHLANRA